MKNNESSIHGKIGFCVVGMGRAGKARCKAIEQMDECSLVKTYSRRIQSTETLESIIQDPRIDAVVICTENDSHNWFVQKALLAKKHVAVEYPLVNELSQAKQLYALAKKNNVVLHCEFIGLLTNAHKQRKKQLQERDWNRFSCHFEGGIHSWILAEIQSHNQAQLAIGRLQAMWDLLGPLRLGQIQLKPFQDGYSLFVQLLTVDGRAVALTETRATGLKRSTRWDIALSSSTASDAAELKNGSENLFVQDLRYFLGSITNGKPSYVSAQDCVDVIALASGIRELYV